MSQPASLNDLPVIETIRYTKKQQNDMARARAVRNELRNVSLRLALRGRTLDEVIAMWANVNCVDGGTGQCIQLPLVSDSGQK